MIIILLLALIVLMLFLMLFSSVMGSLGQSLQGAPLFVRVGVVATILTLLLVLLTGGGTDLSIGAGLCVGILAGAIAAMIGNAKEPDKTDRRDIDNPEPPPL